MPVTRSFSAPPLHRTLIPDAPVVAPDTSLEETLVLLERSEPRIPVLVGENGRVSGIVTENAIWKALLSGGRLSTLRVGDIRSRALVTLTYTGGETALDAWAELREHRLPCLGVVDEKEKWLGIVTAESVLRSIDPTALVEARDDLPGLPNETFLGRIARETRSLYDNAPCGYHSLDGSGIILEMNDTELQMLGYRREEVIGRPVTDFLPPEAVRGFERHFPEFKKRGSLKNLDHPIYRKDGSIIFQNLSATAVYDEDRNFLMTRTVVIDVTDYKRLEFALRDSEARLKDVLQSQIVAIASFRVFDDGDWEYEYYSPGCEALFGYTEAEFMADKTLWISRVLPEDRERLPASFADLAAGHHSTVEYRFRCQDGSIRCFYSTFDSRKSEAGYRTITMVNTDITEKKRLEERFYRAQRLESLGTLAGGIAHDLNNIFTPILAIARTLPLEFPEMKESTRQMLEVLASSARRGANMIKKILLFSRGGGGERVSLSVPSLLAEVLRIAAKTIPDTIEVLFAIPVRETRPVLADPTALQQVMMNLLVNARDAMPEGGTLTLKVKDLTLDERVARFDPDARAGRYVAFSVTDTGTGIPPELLGRVFDPFFTTKKAGEGTGLGLSAVSGIVRAHGGFVRVFSRVGRGSRFTVYLPALEGTGGEEGLTG